MLTEEKITQRLNEMATKVDPSNKKWPENCAGSRKALVIFLGPSPGGKKEESRREIKTDFITPLYGEPYLDPLRWSRGFKVSFEKIVETLFGRPYGEASKLIARINLDWLQNPESHDVPYLFMWMGSKYIFPVILECDPELIIPMDEKSFNILQIALYENGFRIIAPKIGKISIKIFEKNGKTGYHQDLMAYKAIKGRQSIIVIKSLQHPARIYNPDYAKRIGEAIRIAAKLIDMDQEVNINI